jgi:hypothetical protein
MGLSRHVTQCPGNISFAGQSQDTDGKITQRCHHARTGFDPYLRAVLIEGDIADVVTFVFNPPVIAYQDQQLMGIGLLGRQAGDKVSGFPMDFARGDFFTVAIDTTDLSAIRKLHIVVDFRAGPNFADFQPAMGFFDGFSLRGENCF